MVSDWVTSGYGIWLCEWAGGWLRDDTRALLKINMMKCAETPTITHTYHTPLNQMRACKQDLLDAVKVITCLECPVGAVHMTFKPFHSIYIMRDSPKFTDSIEVSLAHLAIHHCALADRRWESTLPTTVRPRARHARCLSPLSVRDLSIVMRVRRAPTWIKRASAVDAPKESSATQRRRSWRR